MSFLELLVENYGYEEPIFSIDLYEELNLNKNTIRQQLKREVDQGNMSRYKYKNGIYFIPKPNSIIKKNTISLNKIINKKYIFNQNKRIGYISGLSFANQIGLTTQNPVKIEIVTEKETNNKREINYDIRKIILRKPKYPKINDKNYKLLQVMDLLNNFEKNSQLSYEEARKNIVNYLKGNQMTKEEIKECVQAYPAKTRARFWESEIYSEITSQ